MGASWDRGRTRSPTRRGRTPRSHCWSRGSRAGWRSPVIEVCGTLDEAVAALGLARATLTDEDLRTLVLELQHGLFAAAARIAANPRARDRLVPGISSVTAQMTTALEQLIDRLLSEHPLRPAFVVPGPATPTGPASPGQTGRQCS